MHTHFAEHDTAALAQNVMQNSTHETEKKTGVMSRLANTENVRKNAAQFFLGQ